MCADVQKQNLLVAQKHKRDTIKNNLSRKPKILHVFRKAYGFLNEDQRDFAEISALSRLLERACFREASLPTGETFLNT